MQALARWSGYKTDKANGQSNQSNNPGHLFISCNKAESSEAHRATNQSPELFTTTKKAPVTEEDDDLESGYDILGEGVRAIGSERERDRMHWKMMGLVWMEEI